MTVTTIGDLAQSYILRRQNSDLKSQMSTLVEELSSGRTSDVSRHLSGSYSYLSDVERNLALLDGYETATSEAKLLTDTMQHALSAFQDVSGDLGLALMSAAQSTLPQSVNTVAARARQDFEVLLGHLNTTSGGRSLFSGVDTDTAPMEPAENILSALRLELVGETTLAGVQSKLDTWFSPGGGFDTLAYSGSTQSLAPIALGSGETVNIDLRADDDAFRVLLKHGALGALTSDPALAFDPELRLEVARAAGEGLAFNQSGLTEIRANLGYAQARVEESSIRIAAERTSFEMARTELLAVDPYETITRLEDVQNRLEGLYTMTARLARLSLQDYLA